MTARRAYIRSKSDAVQIAVEMTDELHALCWGRLWTSTQPHPVPVVDCADPVAWVREQREVLQVSTADRLARLRGSVSVQPQARAA